MLLAFFYQVHFCGLCQICVRGYENHKRTDAFQYQFAYHRYQVDVMDKVDTCNAKLEVSQNTFHHMSKEEPEVSLVFWDE